jgi:uncharacterized protein YraI
VACGTGVNGICDIMRIGNRGWRTARRYVHTRLSAKRVVTHHEGTKSVSLAPTW